MINPRDICKVSSVGKEFLSWKIIHLPEGGSYVFFLSFFLTPSKMESGVWITPIHRYLNFRPFLVESEGSRRSCVLTGKHYFY